MTEEEAADILESLVPALPLAVSSAEAMGACALRTVSELKAKLARVEAAGKAMLAFYDDFDEETYPEDIEPEQEWQSLVEGVRAALADPNGDKP